MVKRAIIQCPDTSPLESLVVMLRHAGYHCSVTGRDIDRELQRIGCDFVVSNDQLVRAWGYERPSLEIPAATLADMERCDLFVDLKAHRSYSKITSRWPRLHDRVLWHRINGAQPEHVIQGSRDCGNELDPPCPVLSPNLWYGEQWWICDQTGRQVECPVVQRGQAYTFWPQFVGMKNYWAKRSRPYDVGKPDSYTTPLCLVHNLRGWGYEDLEQPFREELGIKLYGRGSPDGLLPHAQVPERLSSALAYVHLKSSDAPGYALYEALAAGCPVIVTRKLIWRCKMQELLIPDETCLVFDRETHLRYTPEHVRECVGEVADHLFKLKDPSYNKWLGLQGRQRLQEVMWRQDRDGPAFVEWMRRNFP